MANLESNHGRWIYDGSGDSYDSELELSWRSSVDHEQLSRALELRVSCIPATDFWSVRPQVERQGFRLAAEVVLAIVYPQWISPAE